MSATRSRRSGITDSGGLNPSTIHLLPMARVKKELEARGLDTKGNGAELAFRLQESVRLAGGYASKFDPSPTTETTPQKTRKRKHLEIEIDENVAEVVGEQEAPLPVLVKPFHFTWASAPPTAPRPAKEAMILATEEQLTEEEEMDKQRLEEEEEKRKRSEEEAEEEKKRLKEDEEKRKKKEQAEEDKKRLKEDEEKRKNIEEENKKKLEEAEQHKIKRNEEVEKKKREEEERKRKKREEGNKKKLEREVELRKKKREGEVEKKKKSEEDEEKRKKNREEEMEQQRKKIENEVEKKKKRSEEDEEKRKKRREEEVEQNRKRVVDERKKKEPVKTREQEKEEQLKKESEEQKKVDGQRQQSTASKDPSKIKHSTVPTSTFSSNSVSLDILDSIMDSQQQLLTRKQRKDDEDETEGVQQFKVDFLRRQQRMSTGGKNGASASDIQKRRMSASGLIFGPPPPPPPPKQQKVPTESPKAPPPVAPSLEKPEGSAAVPSTSASSFPLVINLRDPLGLSLVRPERPFPPPLPPPPPPKRQKMPLLQVPELSKTAPPVAPLQEPEETVASTSASSVPLVVNLRDPLGLSLVGSDKPFPPPPPPPPPKRQKVPLSFQASESAPPPVAPLQEPEGAVASTSASPVPLVINLRQPLGLSFVGQNRPFPPPPPPPPPKKNVEHTVQMVQDVREEREETEQNEDGGGKETNLNEDGGGKETDPNEDGVRKETDQNEDGGGMETDQNEDGVGKETNLNEDGGGMETDQNEDGVGKEADPNDKEEEEDTVQLVHDEGEETDQNEDEEGEETDQNENEEADETDQNEDDEEEDTVQLVEDEEEEDAAQLVEEEEAEETDQNEDDEEETDQKSAEYRHLLKDPKSLLQKAQDVLRQKFGGNSDANISSSSAHYEQVGLNVEEFKKETDEEDIRQLPDPEQFHGEPVPEDMDDDLFELAAGLPPRNKNKEQEPKPVEEEPLPDAEHVEMDFYNSDLNMKASSANKWLVDPDNGDGFALMWGGVRANWGVLVPEEENQRVEMPPIAFQAKITEFLSLKHLPFDESDPHQIRVGWSRAGTSNMLGEQSNSFAFSSMGNKASNNLFTDFVDPFVVGEVITSVLDVGRAEIRYYKNGQPLGAAFTDIRYETGDVYFPHIATKNCKVMVNFGTEAPEPTEAAQDESGLCLWSMPSDEVPEETEWIGNLDRKLLASSRRPLADKSHCTIISMVGLPGVGKTTWVLQYLKEHPNEDWILLNTDTILQAMTIDGMPRHRVHQGRWDMVMGLTAKALNRSLQMACRRRHNYILDQTNVFREARKRKLTQFQDFQRKCVVIIPSEAEHERRLIRQAREAGGGGQMPAEAMLEMKGQFSIPCTESEPVDDVIFVEPPIERINEAIEQVMRYNQEGRPWVRNFGHQRTRGPESLISDHSGMPAPRFLGVTRIGI